MSDAAGLRRLDSYGDNGDLTADAAELSRAVADVIDRAGSADSGAAETAAFLRTWADSASPRVGSGTGQPLDLLAERFGLNLIERELLLLAGLPEEHEGLASTFRAIHPRGEPQATVGLAALVLASKGVSRGMVRAVLCEGNAIGQGLLQVSGSGSLFERSLVVADQLWEALHGYDAWPIGIDRIPIGAAPAGYDGWLALPQTRRAVSALRAPDDRTLLVVTSEEVVALGRCAALAGAAGVRLVAARLLPGDAAAAALVAAHAAVRGAVPVLVLRAAADTAPSSAPVLAVRTMPGPVLVCSGAGVARLPAGRPVHAVPMGQVEAADLRTAWRAAIPELADQAGALAARHPIDPALTAQVAIDARAGRRLVPEAGDEESLQDLAEVSGLIRARAVVALPPGIELSRPTMPWNRLVLPEEAARQLRDAVGRVELQELVLDDWGLREITRTARGVRLLFTGPPGTGKSLAAEAVATGLGTDLLLVDVSQVVSKWIGETEKNLAAAFDVAERTQAVLFLDEADALFGSRTELSDAHDRYANLETSYLLQRLDRFDGLAVLATNLRQNIDAAFIRRMDFVVEFPLPDLPGRHELWSLHLPPDRTADDVDIDALARLYPIPGGWIRNAAVAAAYFAAAAGGHVRQQQLIEALRREYAKAALPFPGEPPRRRDDM